MTPASKDVGVSGGDAGDSGLTPLKEGCSAEEVLGELIARLESAVGPDRMLDIELARLMGALVMRNDRAINSNCEYTHHHYTDSLDSAASLAPKGWYGRVQPRFYSIYDRYEENRVLWDGYCIRPLWEKASPVTNEWFETTEARAPTAPLAICIAACKARLAVHLSSAPERAPTQSPTPTNPVSALTEDI